METTNGSGDLTATLQRIEEKLDEVLAFTRTVDAILQAFKDNPMAAMGAIMSASNGDANDAPTFPFPHMVQP